MTRPLFCLMIESGLVDIQIEILVNVLLAFVAGVVIGFDREKSGKPAGIRTQMLVCVGSALLTGISVNLARFYNYGPADPARLMAQIVSGIGFLGAGVILKNGGKVNGVTTAATIWITAAIGIGIGTGFYLPAFASLVLVLLLNPIAHFQYKYGLKTVHYVIKVNRKQSVVVERALRFLHIREVNQTATARSVSVTILSSEQRNEMLLELLKKKKVKVSIEENGNGLSD